MKWIVGLWLIVFATSVLSVRVHQQIDVDMLFLDPKYNISVFLDENTDEIVIEIASIETKIEIYNLSHEKVTEIKKIKKTKDGVNYFEIREPTERKLLAEELKVDRKFVEVPLKIGDTSTIINVTDNTADWWNQSFEYRANFTIRKPASSTANVNEIAQVWVIFPTGYEPGLDALQLTYSNNSTDFYRWYSTNNSTHLTRTRLIWNTTINPGYNQTFLLYWSSDNSISQYNESLIEWMFLDFAYADDTTDHTTWSVDGGMDTFAVSGGFLNVYNQDADFVVAKCTAPILVCDAPSFYHMDSIIQDFGATPLQQVGIWLDSDNYNLVVPYITTTTLRLDIVISSSGVSNTTAHQYADENVFFLRSNYSAGLDDQTYMDLTNNVEVTYVNKDFSSLSDDPFTFRMNDGGYDVDSLCLECYYNKSDILPVTSEASLQEWGIHWWGREDGGTAEGINYLRFEDWNTTIDVNRITGDYTLNWYPDVAYMPDDGRVVAVAIDETGRNVSIFKSENAGADWSFVKDIRTMRDTDQDMTSIVVAPFNLTNISLIMYSADRDGTSGARDGRYISETCSGDVSQGIGWFLFNFSSSDVVENISGQTDIYSCDANLSDMNPTWTISRLDLVYTEQKYNYSYLLAYNYYDTSDNFAYVSWLEFDGFDLELDNTQRLSEYTSSITTEPSIGYDPISDNVAVVEYARNTQNLRYYNYSLSGNWDEGGSQTISRELGSASPAFVWGDMALRSPNSSQDWMHYGFYNDTDNNVILGNDETPSLTSVALTLNVWNTTDTGAASKANWFSGITSIYTTDDFYITHLKTPVWEVLNPTNTTNLTNDNLLMNFTVDFTPVGTCEALVYDNATDTLETTFLSLNPDTETQSDYFKYGTDLNGFYYITYQCFYGNMNKWVNTTSQVFQVANPYSDVNGTIDYPVANTIYVSSDLLPVRHTYLGTLSNCYWELWNTDTGGSITFAQSTAESMYSSGTCLNNTNILDYQYVTQLSGTYDYKLAVFYINETGGHEYAIDPVTNDTNVSFSINWVDYYGGISENFSCDGYLFKHKIYLVNEEYVPGTDTIIKVTFPADYSMNDCQDVKVKNVSFWKTYEYNEEFMVDGQVVTCANSTVGGACSFTELSPIQTYGEPYFISTTSADGESCEVLFVTNVSEGASIKAIILSGDVNESGDNRLASFGALADYGTYYLRNIRRRNINPYYVGTCGAEGVTMYIEDFQDMVFRLIMEDTFNISLNTQEVGDVETLIRLMSPLNTNITVSTGDECTNCRVLNFTIDENTTIVYINYTVGATIFESTFYFDLNTWLNATLPSFINQPEEFSNASYHREDLKVSSPVDVTDMEVRCNKMTIKEQSEDIGQTRYYMWTIPIDAKSEVSYFDLYEPFLGLLSANQELVKDTGTYTFTASCRVINGLVSYSNNFEISTRYDTRKMTGALSSPCLYDGEYGGCINDDGSIWFFMIDTKDKFFTWMRGGIMFFLHPWGLIEWISQPANFVLTIFIGVLLAPFILKVMF
jgi:hypothetical protein